jgi:hypothetical protein
MRLSLSCIILLMVSAMSRAQYTPDGITYQAVARELGGDEIVNQNLTVRIGIIKSDPEGDLVYEEVHDVVTNSFGLFAIVIGNGVITGNALYQTLPEIPFYADAHFMSVEVDTPQSEGFELLGVTQLVAVPYAFHAHTANSAPEVDGDPANELISTVTLNGTTLTISEGGVNHEVNLSGVGGSGGSGGGGQITSVQLSGMNIQVTQNGITYQADLSPIAQSTWQVTGANQISAPGKVGISTDSVQSTLQVNGSMASAVDVYVPISGDVPEWFTLADDQHALIVDVTNGNAICQLPEASSCEGRQYQIRKFSSNPAYDYALTIAAAPGDTIDGQPEREFGFPFAEYVTLVATSSGWYILNYSKEQ